MKRFLLKTLIVAVIFLLILELFSRKFLDDRYFYFLNSYNMPQSKGTKDRYKTDTKHVDYLFIGTSRVPSTINPAVIMALEKSKVAVVAGKGYMPAGLHYLALKNKIENHPGYIKNAAVFIEYPGSGIYTDSYESIKYMVYEPIVKMDEPKPNIIIPHLKPATFVHFIWESKNAPMVKFKTALLYLCSFYRTSDYMKEEFERLNVPISNNPKQELAVEGGIRNDNMDLAKKKAIEVAQIDKNQIDCDPVLTFQMLNGSILARIYDLVFKNGGKLYMYEMPLHSIQAEIYHSKKALSNKTVFENWLTSKNIQVVRLKNFNYQDSDFPDFWHLSVNRRNEFTLKMFDHYKTLASGPVLYSQNTSK